MKRGLPTVSLFLDLGVALILTRLSENQRIMNSLDLIMTPEALFATYQTNRGPLFPEGLES